MSFNKGKEMGDYQREEVEVEEKMYVAVSKETKESRSILTWALQNSGGKKVCIIHVHKPANKLPTPLGYMLASKMGEKEVKAFRDKEREEMSAVLDEYLRISQKCGVRVDKLYIEADSIEKGILQLIEQHNIAKLVMGSAADKLYSRKMVDVKSQKALYVRDNAASFCHIWFICNGYLIHTREATSPPRSSTGDNSPVTGATAPPFDGCDLSPPRWSTDTVDASVSRSGSSREFEFSARRSLSASPMHPQYSMFRNEAGKASGLEGLYIEECMRRKEAETELANVKAELEWMKKTHATELPKNEELESMKNHVAELGKVKAELEYMKNNVLGELRSAVEQKTLLENQIRNSTFLLQMLGDKLASAINVVHKFDEP